MWFLLRFRLARVSDCSRKSLHQVTVLMEALTAVQIALLTIYPIFLSYPVAKAVSPRLGLGVQANIRSTM